MTAADYLAWEVTQTERHEYVDGEVWAMAGNVYMALRQHLRCTPRPPTATSTRT